MRIGIFDSGIGGLIVTKAIVKHLPEYNYLYLGDTKRVPYGNRSPESIYEFTRQAVGYLFASECSLVIIACNTASAQALRRIQQEYLPQHASDKKVLGVIVPTIEEVLEKAQGKRVGVLATQATVSSQTFLKELAKRNGFEVYQSAAPLLVPLIEHDGIRHARPILIEYLTPLMKKKIDTLLLGCTHYPLLTPLIREIVGPTVQVVSQDRIIPKKLADYLVRHPEIETHLEKSAQCQLLVTEKTSEHEKRSREWFGKSIELSEITIE